MNRAGRVKAGRHVSYAPPNRFVMAPVSILGGGGAEGRTGAGELNTSAGGGKVEMVFIAQPHSHANTHQLLTVAHHNARLPSAIAAHAVHAGVGKEVREI